MRPEILYRRVHCIGCGACVKVCPNGAHALPEGFHAFDRRLCIGCGLCAQTCPAGALKLAGTRMSVSQVIGEIMKDAIYYGAEGGMTLSGGEPMLQMDFALALLIAAKENGIGTCVETSGYARPEDMERIVPYVDLFLYDVKLTDPAAHAEMTGVGLERIETNLTLIDRLGAQINLRCPMVPGVNMDDEHIRAIAAIAEKCAGVREIHLEPYHNLGISKADSLECARLMEFPQPDRSDVERLLALLRALTGVPSSIL